ncbi:Hypothetical predicted protein [Paramuricea clavata]|uniref:Uncharacterized protein n=1 Tax=Paramuricea clavata TaxID=317549 RepID=A0A6S7H825_PARCT|nr:Hypothetical predicted protein [Paramuricea clavata]
MSAKVVAKCFWHYEVEEELKECGLREEWVFTSNQNGCGKLYVADGNWKLRYAHCMWKVPVSVPGLGNVNYPNICPLSPKRGHAFCDVHCDKAKSTGYGTELKKLYDSCGVAGVDIGEALDEMSKQPLPLLSGKKNL